LRAAFRGIEAACPGPVAPTGGGKTAVAVNGCHFVMVIGDAEPVVRRLAPTVLAQ
jgi:hypothetical protein